jgi:hypothetical protein
MSSVVYLKKWLCVPKMHYFMSATLRAFSLPVLLLSHVVRVSQPHRSLMLLPAMIMVGSRILGLDIVDMDVVLHVRALVWLAASTC